MTRLEISLPFGVEADADADLMEVFADFLASNGKHEEAIGLRAMAENFRHEKTRFEGVVDSLKNIRATLLEIHDFPLEEMFISGGCIPSFFIDEKPRDIDIYFKDQEVAKIAIKSLKDHISRDWSWKTRISGSAFGISGSRTPHGTLQFVKEAIELEKTTLRYRFDFVHVLGYFDLGTEQLILPNETLHAIQNRLLVPTWNHRDIYGTLERAKKFQKRGWHISVEDLARLNLESSPDWLDIRGLPLS